MCSSRHRAGRGRVVVRGGGGDRGYGGMRQFAREKRREGGGVTPPRCILYIILERGNIILLDLRGGGAKISNFSREKFSCLARWCRGGAVVWEVGAKHISIRPVSRMPGLACGIRCTVVDAKKSEEANI